MQKQWYASVNNGFERLAAQIVTDLGAKEVHVMESAIIFKHDKEIDCPCLNNLFLIVKSYFSSDMTNAINKLLKTKIVFPEPLKGESFRIIYMDKGKLRSVDDTVVKRVERTISYETKCKSKRANPDVEIWLNRLNNTRTYFMVRTKKHKPFDKALKKGELRPDIIEFLVAAAKLKNKSIVLDPFGGSGAIAYSLAKNENMEIYTSDTDESCVKAMKSRLKTFKNCTVEQKNALKTSYKNDMFDAIITEPPWEQFTEMEINEFYKQFIIESRRILKSNGRLIMLSGAKKEAAKALQEQHLSYDEVPVNIGGINAILFLAKKR